MQSDLWPRWLHAVLKYLVSVWKLTLWWIEQERHVLLIWLHKNVCFPQSGHRASQSAVTKNIK